MNLYNRFSLLSLYPPRRSHVMSAPQSLNPDNPREKTLPQRPTLSFSSEMGGSLLPASSSFHLSGHVRSELQLSEAPLLCC